ncbi:MAG: WD40 repeat domain-containing protein, partial [Bacteroidota bacterium]
MQVKKINQLTGHRSAIYALHAGREPATFLSAGGDGYIVEWRLDEPENGQLIAQVEGQVFSLAWLAELETLVAGDLTGGVHWLRLSAPEQNRHIAHHQKGTHAILNLTDNLVLTFGQGGTLTRWDALRARSLESLQL